MTATRRIGFLGAGQMATALAQGWAAAGLLEQSTSWASDPYTPARERFTAATGISTSGTNEDVAKKCDVLVLAVKPQTMPAVLAGLQRVLTPNHLVVSIAAGVTLAQLGSALGEATRLIRVMPNTPCLVGASASAYAASPKARPDDLELVATLFGAVGEAFAVPEKLLDAVTGLSGSGPAYVYVIIEALADGGVRMGLPRDVALRLAAQTVLGSAQMVLATGQHPATLKDAVASPGGTTIAGLHALERGSLRAALINAVEAATLRAEELGKKS
jgi:pyrroline-5-carboxylate reductase